ncbi:MAG: hypothetical protein ACI8RZ_001678 [Myxococcota bacterium]|jgi:hypothetical protein
MTALLFLNPALAQEAIYAVCADPICMDCEPATIEAVLADSVLTGNYGAHLALDGDQSTAWCEGVDGTGVGQSLSIALAEPELIEAILIHGGYFKSASLLAANGRIKAMTMVAENGMGGPRIDASFQLADPAQIPATDPCGAPGTPSDMTSDAWFSRASTNNGALVWQNDGTFTEPMAGINLTISDVFPGAKFADTCISEIQIFVRD